MSELAEAVNAATAATSQSIIQKVIDTNLLEYQRRYSPLLAATPSKKIDQAIYLFVQRTRRPAGGAVVDGGARANSNSTWNQLQFPIKNYQLLTGITGFAQEVTAGVVGDLARRELDGGMQSQLWALETSMLYGNAAATAGITSLYGPDMDGLDTQVSQYTASGSNPQNVIDAAEANLSLGGATGLDSLIDLVEENAAMPIGSDWMFLCSPKAYSKVAGLLTNQQRFMGAIEVAAGLNVQSYRDIPLVKSSFLAARSQAFGTVTPSAGGTGGTLAATTYYYRVAAIINRYGELAASAEVSQAVTAGQNVTLTFATPTDLEGNESTLYKVFRSTASGAEVLVGVCAAVDVDGNVLTSIVDTGANLLPNGQAPTGLYPTAYSGAAGALGQQKPRNATDEDILLVPRNADFMVRPFVRDFRTITLAQTAQAPDVMPFAIINDTTLAVRGPKYVGKLARLAVAL